MSRTNTKQIPYDQDINNQHCVMHTLNAIDDATVAKTVYVRSCNARVLEHSASGNTSTQTL